MASPLCFMESGGAFLLNDTATVDDLKQRDIKILISKLTPWQRIDCLKTFLFPSLNFFNEN